MTVANEAARKPEKAGPVTTRPVQSFWVGSDPVQSRYACSSRKCHRRLFKRTVTPACLDRRCSLALRDICLTQPGNLYAYLYASLFIRGELARGKRHFPPFSRDKTAIDRNGMDARRLRTKRVEKGSEDHGGSFRDMARVVLRSPSSSPRRFKGTTLVMRLSSLPRTRGGFCERTRSNNVCGVTIALSTDGCFHFPNVTLPPVRLRPCSFQFFFSPFSWNFQGFKTVLRLL